MNRQIIILILLGWASLVSAQRWDWWPLAIQDTVSASDTLLYQGYLSGLASSGQQAPFLLRANQHANISTSPYSGNISLGIFKPASQPKRWWDYDFAVQLTGRIGSHDLTGYFQQLYAHARLYIVDFTVGIQPMVCGSQSPSLSMGGLLFSGNAHPIPRVSVGINDYIAFPGLYGYLEIKGGLNYGWLYDASAVSKTKFHHKFVGFRLGGQWPVTLAYEMHHASQWGGYHNGVDYGNSLADFWNVFLFRSGGTSSNEQLNAQGNHIGFQELALTYKQRGWLARVYWQSLFEDMSAAFIGFGMNAADGLWGLHIQQKHWPYINQLTYEFLNTTSQSGPFHDKDGLIFAGRDSYFHNMVYTQGWTYFSSIIGNPYLQINNSRVRAHFAGIGGDIYGYRYRLMASHVNNYGTYQLPSHSASTAVMLELSRRFERAWGLEFSVALAGDFGTQYGNQFGAMISIRKQGIITQW